MAFVCHRQISDSVDRLKVSRISQVTQISHFHTWTLSHFHTLTLSHFHSFKLFLEDDKDDVGDRGPPNPQRILSILSLEPQDPLKHLCVGLQQEQGHLLACLFYRILGICQLRGVAPQLFLCWAGTREDASWWPDSNHRPFNVHAKWRRRIWAGGGLGGSVTSNRNSNTTLFHYLNA